MGGFLTFQRIWMSKTFGFFIFQACHICAFLCQCSYEGFRGNICDHSVNRKAKILEGPAFMVYRPYLLTYLVVISKIATNNIFLDTQKFKVCHEYHKWTIQYFFFSFWICTYFATIDIRWPGLSRWKNLLYVNYLLCGYLELKYNIYEDRTHVTCQLGWINGAEKVCYILKSNKY